MVPTEYYVALSGLIFSIGAVGVLTRRSAIMIFLSVELMLNAANSGAGGLCAPVVYSGERGGALGAGGGVYHSGDCGGGGGGGAGDSGGDFPQPGEYGRGRAFRGAVVRGWSERVSRSVNDLVGLEPPSGSSMSDIVAYCRFRAPLSSHWRAHQRPLRAQPQGAGARNYRYSCCRHRIFALAHRVFCPLGTRGGRFGCSLALPDGG